MKWVGWLIVVSCYEDKEFIYEDFAWYNTYMHERATFVSLLFSSKDNKAAFTEHLGCARHLKILLGTYHLVFRATYGDWNCHNFHRTGGDLEVCEHCVQGHIAEGVAKPGLPRIAGPGRAPGVRVRSPQQSRLMLSWQKHHLLSMPSCNGLTALARQCYSSLCSQPSRHLLGIQTSPSALPGGSKGTLSF